MSSIAGNKIKVSVFGESHGEAIGCVIDGLPAGININMDEICLQMARRAPGRDKTATPRLEKDFPRILSGVLNSQTTGAPLAAIIENQNTKSGDYANVLSVPRPSHSDYPAFVKYGGKNDIRGGGHFSGRLTAPLVFAGAVARSFLAEKGISIGAHIAKIGSVYDSRFDLNNIEPQLLNALSKKSFSVISPDAEEKMRCEVEKYRLDSNSVGGEIECAAVGIPAGVGGNMFDTVEGNLAKMLFGIPAVKGVQFGLGFGFAEANAADVNDEYEICGENVHLLSNNCGGIAGGITTGAPLVFSVAIKPTPSISKPQKSINLQTMENEELIINGRHDPCIVPRAVSVVEAVCAISMLDMII